ncbi:hypothetical protein llap_18069 [Limosa lapponica baueri]|uniref:Core shell protein Gag P30 domain-containing protein n=1 Tax=Limosa lapponica baueri TaxID=1758121 RepID=A0A2I0TCX1_LIMLA|nr:hypothetical protein llap_18069 [Limosa lapponica baueri]
MGPTGSTQIKVPFSMNDLDSWKEIVKEYWDDPIGVTKRYELIVKNQDPDWKDIDIMLDALTETEKQLVLKMAQTHVQAQITASNLPGNVDNYVPLTEPGWDPNNPNEYQQLKCYQEWIKFGLENAVPKAVNWSALYAVKQGQTESPTDFLERLRERMGPAFVPNQEGLQAFGAPGLGGHHALHTLLASHPARKVERTLGLEACTIPSRGSTSTIEEMASCPKLPENFSGPNAWLGWAPGERGI